MEFLQEYTLLEELGRGGFATVYKVRHNELGYVRAIRVLNETIVDGKSTTYQKFLRECRTLLRLGNGNHPNIVHIYQPRLLDNKALVEMDYVDGLDLHHYLERNQHFVPVDEVIRMATQMSSALAYCHEDIYRYCMDRTEDNLRDDPADGSKVLLDGSTRRRLIEKYKVIHNDIHSGNIMRRVNGDFVLLDFGLAIEGDEVVRTSRHVNGAPEFKSPEKWDNEAILTEQSDIYSFGIVLYQYLAGRVPFPYDTAEKSKYKAEAKIVNAHQKSAPPDIENLRRERYEQKYVGQQYERDYPQWLEDAIMKCLSKNPADRFKNGKELHDFIISHSDDSETGTKSDGDEDSTSGNDDQGSSVNQQPRRLLLPIMLGLMLAISLGVICYLYYQVKGSEHMLGQKNEEITKKDDVIEQKDNLIEQKDKEIEQLNKRIAGLKTTTPAVNFDEIIRLQNLVSERDKQISNLKNQLANKSKTKDNSAEITRLQNQVNERDNQINDLKKQLETASKLKSKDNSAEINSLKQQIKDKNQEIRNKDQQIQKLTNEKAVIEKNCL